VLGRDVYSEREKIAWSIVVATKGIAGFVDQLLNSDEYLNNFGYNTVPYQRRRVYTAGMRVNDPSTSNLPVTTLITFATGLSSNHLAKRGTYLQATREDGKSRRPISVCRYGTVYCSQNQPSSTGVSTEHRLFIKGASALVHQHVAAAHPGV
jgi:hypothetical protein